MRLLHESKRATCTACDELRTLGSKVCTSKTQIQEPFSTDISSVLECGTGATTCMEVEKVKRKNL